MKKWENPKMKNLSIQNTLETYCPWVEIENYKNDKGCTCDFFNPNQKPTDQHSDYVWCTQHNRWHPKQHGSDNGNDITPGQS